MAAAVGSCQAARGKHGPKSIPLNQASTPMAQKWTDVGGSSPRASAGTTCQPRESSPGPTSIPLNLASTPPGLRVNWRRGLLAKSSMSKADSTLRTSRAVPHPSTNRALCRLTSEVERDPVHSTRYGRQRQSRKERTGEGETERERKIDEKGETNRGSVCVCDTHS